jgi:pyruvate dehydrogenase E1 component
VSIRNDVDPEETREWLEALDDVLRNDGPERAEALIGELLDRARRRGVPLEVGLNTPYVNTIPVDREEQCPGDLELEHRIRAIIRWNAIALVLNANKESS